MFCPTAAIFIFAFLYIDLITAKEPSVFAYYLKLYFFIMEVYITGSW
jgi:hypothetical protein